MSTAPEGPPVTATQESGYLSHRQILVVLGGLMAGMFLAALDMSIVGTALPRVVSDLGGLNEMSWVVTAYLLTSTASTPLWGKISDLYGRRLIFQGAIVTFLIGSLFSGSAQNMTELISSRAIQGLGGGGLMALALAVIGDIIPPRERGRYQGYFAAVFGTSSVLGPVLGGFFTDGPGWRWIFFINVPIGLVALAVTSAALKIPTVRREHTIDYLGAASVVTAVTSLLLFTAWSGPDLGWFSTTSVTLLALGAVFAVLFVFVELRAAEPIIPMELFAERTFSIASIFVFIIGVAMFGSLVFMPLYLQVVDGMGPTQSGLALLPMVVGLFSTSISSGQIMSRTGRYRPFPILGAATVTVSMLLLSRLNVGTPYWQAALVMWLLGAGLGFTMQVMVTVVQNSVSRRHMGTATSSVMFFRSMGGAFGAALFGAIMTSRLTHYLPTAARSGAGGDITNNVQKIQSLPGPEHSVIVTAFNSALSDVFLVAVPIVLIALAVSFFLPEKPLRAREVPTDPTRAAADVTADEDTMSSAR
jgi:EmrB/QacA subfamily drug resistance transporter